MEYYHIPIISGNDEYSKTGYLLKHSCGKGTEEELASLEEHPWGWPAFYKRNIIYWKRTANLYDLILNPFGKKDAAINIFNDFLLPGENQ